MRKRRKEGRVMGRQDFVEMPGGRLKRQQNRVGGPEAERGRSWDDDFLGPKRIQMAKEDSGVLAEPPDVPDGTILGFRVPLPLSDCPLCAASFDCSSGLITPQGGEAIRVNVA